MPVDGWYCKWGFAGICCEGTEIRKGGKTWIDLKRVEWFAIWIFIAKTHPQPTVCHFYWCFARVAQVEAILPVQIPCGFLADLMEAKQSTGDVCCIFTREIKRQDTFQQSWKWGIGLYFHVDFRPQTYGGNVFHLLSDLAWWPFYYPLM